jgi:hypothetical protein
MPHVHTAHALKPLFKLLRERKRETLTAICPASSKLSAVSSICTLFDIKIDNSLCALCCYVVKKEQVLQILSRIEPDN